MGRLKRFLRYCLGGALMAAGLVATYRNADRQNPPETNAFTKLEGKAAADPDKPRKRHHEKVASPEAEEEKAEDAGEEIATETPVAAGEPAAEQPIAGTVEAATPAAPLTDLPLATNDTPQETPTPAASPEPSPFLTAAAPAAAQSAVAPAEDIPASATPGRSSAVLLQRADELVLQGMYASAFRVLSAIPQDGTPGSAAEVRFRIGLCSELSGDATAAQTHYEAVLNTHGSHPVGQQAFRGLMRIWNVTGRRSLSSSALYRQIVRSEAGSSAATEEAWHLLGLSLASQVSPRQKDSLDDRVLFFTEPVLRVAEIFAALGRTETPSNPSRGTSEGVDVLERFGSTPDAVRLRASLHQKPLRDVIRSFVTAAGWSVEFSEMASARLTGRTMTCDIDNADAAFLLDAGLSELGLGWKFENSLLVVQDLAEFPAEEQNRLRIARALRVLQTAVDRAPRHPLNSYSCVALGRLAALSGRPAEALRICEQTSEQSGNLECHAELWTNRGKLLLVADRRKEALEAFYRVIDAIDSHPLKAICYLYVGRLHLEDGHAGKAVPALMRSLALLEKSSLEPCAANMLAGALLLDGNPHGANAVLMKRRQRLSEGNLIDQSAMVAALARYRSAVEPERKRQAAVSLVEALSHVNPDTMFGGHWWCLTIDGLRETGMTHEANRLREECLRKTRPFPLRERLLINAIQDKLRSVSSSSQPVEQTLQGFAGSEVVSVRNEVRLLDARAAHQNGLSDAALERCRVLVQDQSVPNDIRREALRMMGTIYQLREDYASAVLCFSGMLPVAATPLNQLGMTPEPSAPQ